MVKGIKMDNQQHNNKIDIKIIRHSLSHLLATVVLKMFPTAKFGIGPAIENGFYYDFDLPRTINQDDLKQIEKNIKEIIKKDICFVKKIVTKDEAIEFLESTDQEYKIELINELTDEEISFYTIKDNRLNNILFSDMCKGPHVDSTKQLKSIGFKIDKVSSAYWRGNENNTMLQRIYGLAFQSKDDLKDYIYQRIEAEKRDHRKLGKDLDLFVFSNLVGSGLPMYTPKGTIIIEELKKHVENICKKYGFQKVITPHLSKIDLFKLSGHADKFGDELFHVTSSREHKYVLKPVLCPHHTQIYTSRPRSYRDLPIRYMESEKQYRAEKTGEIGGLTRVIAITIEDGHSFCRVNQVKQEVKNIVQIIKDFYTDLEMWENHWVSLSVRDYNNQDKYIGYPKDWDICEQMLKEVSDEMKLDAKKCEGEAALYGPKLDFMFKDAIGREIQIPTVQLDFATPKRFNLLYTNEEGKDEHPVIVHRAILGSYERFLALLIEHFAGAFPIWLAPIQAKILPIADRHHKYANFIFDEFNKNNIRVEIDIRSESIGKKIREAEVQKIPYMIIIGDKEIDEKNISVRKYNEGDKGKFNTNELIKRIKSR